MRVAVVGGGIVGCAAAAFLAEAGASVELYERGRLAGAASGRNSGSVQHPFDPVLVPLHEETLRIYRELPGFELPERPAGVLMLARDAAGLAAIADGIARGCPELRPQAVVPADADPALAQGLAGLLLDSGYPVAPAAATTAFSELARRRGAVLHEDAPASLDPDGGVVVSGRRRDADAILVAAGPWTPEVVDPTGRWSPIAPVWGVVAEVAVAHPPRHVLEEAGVEAVAEGGPRSIFSLVHAGGSTVVGSTFDPVEPDARAVAPALRDAGAAFVPSLEGTRIVSARACARPQSVDGRPLVGRVSDGVHVVAGHGPWGISTGPASARLAVDGLLGRADPPRELAAERFPL